MISLACRVPHLSSARTHEISLSVDGHGSSPQLEMATFTTPPLLRSIAPDGGSVAGGMLLTLHGDGFSTRRGDIDVTLGAGGGRCRTLAANTSQIVCRTSAAATTVASSTFPVAIHVRGVTANHSTAPTPITYTFDLGRTPSLTAAEWIDRTSAL